MADLSKIKLNGVEYDLKDAYARENIPNKINNLTDKMFGIAWLDNNDPSGYIYCNNVNFSSAGSSDFSSPFLFMVKKTTNQQGNVTLLHRGNFYFYNINDNYSYGIWASNISVYPSTEKLQYGKFYIGYLNDGTLDLYPLARQRDVDSAIATAIGNINQFEVAIVTDLPTTDIDAHTIYFKSNSSSGNNIYDEYMYINNNWELIGSTQVDLSNYLQTSDIAAWAKAATKPTYTASEVGALPSTYTAPVTSVNGQTGAVSLTIPTATSDLINDSGFITDAGVTSFNGLTGIVTYTAPVSSVNGQTGAVTLSIPAAQVQSDWNATTGMGVILNKPTIPAATTVTNTLSSGTLIATINGTNIYAPSYTNGDEVSY